MLKRSGRVPASQRGTWGDLQRELLADMRRRGLQRGQALPSIREISREHGVSKARAERAVAGLVEEGVCYAQQGRGVFLAVDGPDSAEASLAPVLTVGVVFGFQEYPATDHPFYRQVYEGFAEWVAASGANVLKLYNWRTKNRARKVREVRQFADGLGGLVALGVYSDDDLLLLRQTGLPLVALDCDTQSLGIDCAVLEHDGTMEELAGRAMARNPGPVFLATMERRNREDSAPAERREAVRRAAQRAGRAFGAESTVSLPSGDGGPADAGRLAPAAAAARESGGRLVLILDDDYILGRTVAALASLGLGPGGGCTLAYIGSRDLPAGARSIPALVGAYDFRELGRAGSRLLAARIEAGPGRPVRAEIPGQVLENAGSGIEGG